MDRDVCVCVRERERERADPETGPARAPCAIEMSTALGDRPNYPSMPPVNHYDYLLTVLSMILIILLLLLLLLLPSSQQARLQYLSLDWVWYTWPVGGIGTDKQGSGHA